MKILSVVGARPQFVKLAAMAKEFSQHKDIEHIIVHTGQHYDPIMSDAFFEAFSIPDPDVHLGVGSGSHGVQTGAMLAALDGLIADTMPDWTLVYGDTNSTIAGALAAAKLHVPVAHLEAGLRSHNRRMPEEHNRVLTDHASDLLLAPTQTACDNLANEGLESRTVNVGDVMADVCLDASRAVMHDIPELPDGVKGAEPYLVATIHRAENTDNACRLMAIIGALRELTAPVVLLCHPRLVARAAEFGIHLEGGAIRPSGPLGYFQMVRALMGASGAITDSGGLQKEAFLLRVPCTTLREETEWVETLIGGWNILDPGLKQLDSTRYRAPSEPRGNPYGVGDAAARVVVELQRR